MFQTSLFVVQVLLLTVPDFALLTSAVGTGTLKFSGTNSFDGTLYSGAYTIPVTMGLWLNNPNFATNGFNGTITLNGLFRMTAGTFNIGTSAGNAIVVCFWQYCYC